MSREADCDLVVACSRLLYLNGQGTEQVLGAAERLVRALGLPAKLSLRWGELQLQLEEGSRPIWRVAANPAGVDMTRVIAGMRLVDDVCAGRVTPEAAQKAIDVIRRSGGSPTWLFALASGAGAVAMAVIFGVEQIADAAMIFASAFLGALLRRGLHRLSTNALIQPFCASLLAGIFAAVAFRYQLVTSLRFVALCPCVILVPGAHVLNGLADLINGRLHLGAARLIHAGLIIAAITTGLLFGLVLCGASLPLAEAVRAVPLWQHMLAAAVAVAAFGVLFSMPLRLLLWPVLVGAFAQALRWAALTAGFGVGAAALIASLAIGLILIPIARKQQLPFAAIGFIAVVSMIPGSYLFTMAAGLAQIAAGGNTTLELIGVTLASGSNALLIILAISLGLVIPKLALDFVEERRKADA
jgi:uncharacterized membrane protein YjjP (DUF1212 family)